MYEFGDFKDPIDTACSQAFARLKDLVAEKQEFADNGDSAVEHIESIQSASPGDLNIKTSTEYFACGFDDIHDDMIRQADVPDYFNDVIAGMVRTIVMEREESGGNDDPTLLMPAKDALGQYVTKRWDANEMNRWLRNSFWVYKFELSGNKGRVEFVYDETKQSWKLGYTIAQRRILLRWGRNIYEETEDGTLLAEPIVTIPKPDNPSK